MPKTLFPDQRTTITDLYAAWDKGYQRPLVVKPTGTGKTVIFTEIARQEAQRGHRVLVVVDQKELIDQTMRTMAADMPGVHVGAVQGGRNQALAQVVVASKQTLDKPKRIKAIGCFDVIIIDEAHMAAAQGYIDALKILGAYDRSTGVRVAGFTATADRTGDLGLGDVFEHVAHVQPVEEAFRLRRLVRPEIRQRRLRSNDPQAIVADILDQVGRSEQGVVYAGTVKEAHQIRDAFRRAGVSAEAIFDSVPANVRDRIYAATRARENMWLINVNVLVKGFDMPQLTVAVILRKMSQVPYVQSVGRVLRTDKGKTYAIVLDYAGNDHPLQVTPNIAPSIEGKREAATARTEGRKAEPVRKPESEVSYRIHIRIPRIGRKHAVVDRIERTGTVRVAKIYGHPRPRLESLAREAVRKDQEQRIAALKSRIVASGGKV